MLECVCAGGCCVWYDEMQVCVQYWGECVSMCGNVCVCWSLFGVCVGVCECRWVCVGGCVVVCVCERLLCVVR